MGLILVLAGTHKHLGSQVGLFLLFGDDLSRTALDARCERGARILASPADDALPRRSDLLFVVRGDGHLEPVTRNARPAPHPGETVVLLGAGMD